MPKKYGAGCGGSGCGGSGCGGAAAGAGTVAIGSCSMTGAGSITGAYGGTVRGIATVGSNPSS
ncbi:MAG: hypothetical protein NVSMB64_09210 [Candidatus Velthaea sp.]